MLVLKSSIKTIETFKIIRHISISYEIILREFVTSLLRLLSFNLLKCRRFIVVMRQHTSAVCIVQRVELDDDAQCRLTRRMLPHNHNKSTTF